MSQLIIKKSKFLGYVFPVSSEHEVKSILEQLQSEHKKASHVCYAFSCTNPFAEKAYDAGEPSGCAGRPILYVIQKRASLNILVVVVRYFGGIKLGGGGLKRAYMKCAGEALKEAGYDN